MQAQINKRIIFWLPAGRLGNLIFQYQAALNFIADGAIVVTPEIGLSDVIQTNIHFKFIYVPMFLRDRFVQFWIFIFRLLLKYKVIGVIKPLLIEENGYFFESKELIEDPGFFSSLWAIEGFFQNNLYVEPAPKIKSSLLNDAERALINIPAQRRVAIHLRFGDYIEFTVLGIKGASLPLSFYDAAIATMKLRLADPVFVIFTDDKKKASNLLGYGNEFIFLNKKSLGFDIAAMSLCSHAIISASTFAWWGAFLIKSPDRIVIAPKYWAGFKSRVWFPKDIFTKKYEYIDVNWIE